MDKRILMIGLLVTLAIAGCSGKSEVQSVSSGATDASATADASGTAGAGTKAKSVPKPLEIAESGYSVVDGPRVEYAFYLRNPNKDWGAQYPGVQVVMRDAAGSVIDSSAVTFGRWLMPGETAAIAGEASSGGKRPAKVTFEPLDPALTFKWKTASEASKEIPGVLTTKGFKAKKTASGVSFTGVVLNPPVTGVDEFLVSIILRDKSKRIVGGYATLFDEILTGSQGTFTVDSVRNVPKYATFEVYAQRW